MLKLKEITKERILLKNWSHYVRGLDSQNLPKEAAFVYCQNSLFYLLPKWILKYIYIYIFGTQDA
jgi:hypothetical protein